MWCWVLVVMVVVVIVSVVMSAEGSDCGSGGGGYSHTRLAQVSPSLYRFPMLKERPFLLLFPLPPSLYLTFLPNPVKEKQEDRRREEEKM